MYSPKYFPVFSDIIKVTICKTLKIAKKWYIHEQWNSPDEFFFLTHQFNKVQKLNQMYTLYWKGVTKPFKIANLLCLRLNQFEMSCTLWVVSESEK
mgnify:FL=1